jgi:AraC family transcriptional regulator
MRLDSPPMRIDVATGRRRPIPGMGKISSGQFWKGLRLEGLSAGPGEHVAAYATQHFICVMGGAVRVENSWPGGRRKVRQYLSGQVGLIPAMMPTANRWESFRATALFLDPELLSAGPGYASRGRIELRPAMEPQEDALLKELALVLRKEVQSGYPGGALYGESLGAAIAAHVVRRYAVAPCGAADLRGAMAVSELRRIEEYVEENLATSLSLQQLAQQVEMNVYCFVRAFKRSTGLPPHQYVVRRRLERAKFLLLDPEASIADIALRCGFATQSHLTAAFSRLTNVTPGEYRRAIDRGHGVAHSRSA